MNENRIVDLVDVGLENEHDQLPNVEEVRTVQRVGWSKKILVLGAAAFALFVIIVALIVTVSVDNNSQHDKASIKVDRMAEIEEFLGKYSASDALKEPSSAQFKAAQWMAVQDTQQVPVQDSHFLQRFALMTLYFSTGGMNWFNEINFASSAHDECDWNHKSVDISHTRGVVCDEDKQIISLVIDSMGLVGTLPPELSLLTNLQHLSFDTNSLSGDIPNLQAMTHLESLSLAYNNFYTELPKWFGTLHQLITLRLSNNNFKHAIPTEFQTMRSLKNFIAGRNMLSGNLNTIEQMHWLETLYLQGNHLTGTIANDFLSNLHGLRILNLSDNQLKGKLPSTLFQHSSLAVLAIDENSITESIPVDIPRNSALRIFTFAKNQITGTIPSSIHRLINLEVLDVSSNRLSGVIPTAIGMMSKMTSLSLSENEFATSAIPPFLRSMPLLRDLSLRHANLVGDIPSWLGTDFDSLVLLDLDDNSLTGSLPTQIASSTKLEMLMLSRNSLTGMFPTELSEMSKLGTLQNMT